MMFARKFLKGFYSFISDRHSWYVIGLWIFLGVLLLSGLPSRANALKVEADFADSDGSPALTDGTKFRINKIFVSFQDPTTGKTISGRYDVIFQWDEDTWVLRPVEILGCYNGSLRVHVSNSVTGDPIEGAQVTANGETMTTDEDGIARFNGLLNDKLTVRVEATNYNSNGFEVEIPCNGEQRVSAALMPQLQ